MSARSLTADDADDSADESGDESVGLLSPTRERTTRHAPSTCWVSFGALALGALVGYLVVPTAIRHIHTNTENAQLRQAISERDAALRAARTQLETLEHRRHRRQTPGPPPPPPPPATHARPRRRDALPPAAASTAAAAAVPRPLKPLPATYLSHLAYMDRHPSNGPEGGLKNGGRWMSGTANHERGLGSRDAELKAIMRQSGWGDDDSPPALGTGTPLDRAPLLTGNAWHFGAAGCPAACAANGGVCFAPLARCDCPRHRWGPACEQLVQPAVARTSIYNGWCVYNDSKPWMCDWPTCTSARAEEHLLRPSATAPPQRRACVGSPIGDCPQRCSERGICEKGRCRCHPGFSGTACERAASMWCPASCNGRGKCDGGFCACAPPYYGVDCSLSPSPPPPAGHADRSGRGHLGQLWLPTADERRGPTTKVAAAPKACTPPCVYVYELPARMNVLAMKAEPQYAPYGHGPADYRAFKAMHVSLLRSAHRTADPKAAHYFYIPAWDFHGAWGNPEVYWRASRYVRTHFPFWNASGGADHIWANTRDAGTCSNPWGSIWEETNNAIVLQNWGGVTGLGGIPTERCFDARKDIVVPGVLSERVLRRSPFVEFYAAHPDDGAAAAEAAAGAAAVWDRKKTLLFFHGAICWQTYDHVDGLKGLDRKCKRQHGFIDHYSFGVRYEVYRRHHAEPGFKLRATDVKPGPPRANLDDEVLASTFCLCPSGTGWGMRAYHAAALGCLPVLIQQDEKQTHPQVLQAFEGLLLDWDAFAVRLPFSSIKELPSILRALAANATALKAKRRALAAVIPRLLWRVATPSPAREAFANTEDAFSSVMATLAVRRAHGLRGEQ